jgi:MSHA biogenesis protein MshQ
MAAHRPPSMQPVRQPLVQRVMRSLAWRLLGVAGLLLSALPAHALDYVFPGTLPAGCADNSGGSYDCPAMVLGAGDTVTIAAPMPATITFHGALSVGAGSFINQGGNASDLQLVVNGAFGLGANSILMGSVRTVGAGAVVVGAGGTVGGSIDTDVGYVSLGASASIGGSITTVTGYVSLAASGRIAGSIRTSTGYVELGALASVLSSIETLDAGYVLMGVGAQVSGPIAVSGEGYVMLGDNAIAWSSISTLSGPITVGAGAQVAGQVSTQGTALITIGAGGVIFSVCCNPTNADCVSGNVAVACIAPSTMTPVNFECLETGAALANLVTSPGLRNPLYTKLAGTSFTLDVAALRTDGTLQDSYGLMTSQVATVELVAGAGVTACTSRAAAVASQAITFSSSDKGRKTVTFNVPAASGDLRCRITDANRTPNIVGCSSDDFSVRPGGVTLLTAAMAPGPSAAALPGVRTGAGFALRATTPASDAYTGALLLDAAKLSAQSPGQDTQVQSGGAVGVLAAVALAANAADINATYSEVGYLYLAPGAYRDDIFTAVDRLTGDCISDTTGDQNLATTLVNGQYGCSVGTQATVSLGRFFPDHFEVTLPVSTPACAVGTPFSYFGQDGFTTAFTLTASNADSVPTRNYTGAYARLNPGAYATYGFESSALPAGAVLAPSALAPSGSWDQGVARVSVRHQVGRPAAPTPETLVSISAAPFDGEVKPTARTAVGEGVRLRFGRLRMKNAYGSELLALPVPLEAQYWVAGGYYVTNTDDSCTAIPAASIVMGNYLAPLAACQTRLSPAGAAVLRSGKLPAPGLVLSRPGAGHAGSVDLELNVTTVAHGATCVSATGSGAMAAQMPWFGSSPGARATFGLYKSRLLYSRENY